MFLERLWKAVPRRPCDKQRLLRQAMVVALALAAMVSAASERAVQKSVEAEMRVVGTVAIGPDGKLLSYSLPSGYPAEVEALVKRYLADRSFDVAAASGESEAVNAVMSLQVVARQNGRGGADISIGDSLFQAPGEPHHVKARRLRPPEYPSGPERYTVTGVVYLALRLAADGSVDETHVERVNLTGFGSEREMQMGRDLLANAVAGQAKTWTFEVAPELTDKAPVSVRIAVEFVKQPVKSQAKQTKATWQQYVPGPYHPIPWLTHSTDNGLGAIVPGWIFPIESSIQLRKR